MNSKRRVTKLSLRKETLALVAGASCHRTSTRCHQTGINTNCVTDCITNCVACNNSWDACDSEWGPCETYNTCTCQQNCQCG